MVGFIPALSYWVKNITNIYFVKNMSASLMSMYICTESIVTDSNKEEEVYF